MKARYLLFFAVLLLSLTGVQSKNSSEDSSKKSIPWGVTDWPPYYILEGGNGGEGKIDLLKKILEKNISEYKFIDVQSDIPKTIELWKQNRNICAGSVLKTPEREKWAYFTALSFIAPHEYLAVVAKKDILPKGDVMSFKELTTRKDLKGVVIHDRSYGPVIDDLIKKAESNLTALNPSEGYMPLLKMVQRGRFDYTIEYESVVKAYNERIKPEKPVHSKLLKETSPSAVIWVACTKNAWGRNVISRIDEVLKKNAGKSDYHAAVESWSNPEALKKHQKALDEFYERRAHSWSTINVE
ncbi:TIGR02285 family protein [Bdellovibrio reynosensis]|uniref:TIGR02285 family protein n=1 Tax=Bdellovibrio reynosensis TaxID=2835041 RepID=A0ABY4CAG4_9BACT|nr:TIGR02285 family protein [Bdellovibrio reynosensis]UOF01848.1 TIGR02285 family protein [Bdellovibrio reynosensis]